MIKLSLKFVMNYNFNPENQHTEHNLHKLKQKEPAQKSVAVYSFRLPKIISRKKAQPTFKFGLDLRASARAATPS